MIWAVLLVLGMALPAPARRAPPPLHQAAEIEALVNKAADLLEAEGARAFDAFRRRGSVWRYGDVYLFVVDLRGVVLFNAAHPNREGHDLLHERDADGKRVPPELHRRRHAVRVRLGRLHVPEARSAGSEREMELRLRDARGGVEALVGAGVYVE
ncbi:cache domain-containing protein [Methylobacterium oryzae CBMB20]